MPFDLSKLQAYTEIKEKPEKSESWDDLIESAFKTEPEKGLPQQVASGSNSQDTSAGQTKNMPAASDSWDDLISAAFKNESEMNTGSTPEATGLNDLKNRLVDFDKSNQAFLNEWDAKEKELEKVKKSFDPTKVNAVLSYLHENGGKRKQLKQEREELLSSIYNHPELIAERKEKAAELEKRMAEMDKLYDGSNVPVLGTGPGAYMMKGKKEQDAEREADRFSRAYKLYENAHDMLLAPSKFDKSNAFLNFAKGSGKVLSDKDFWTGGMSAIARNLDLGSIFKKISENKEGKDFKDLLTPGESSLLDAYYAQVNAQAERAKDLSLGYQAGQGAAQSLEYMAEFLATGGLATAASSGAKKAAMKWIIKHSAPASLKRQALKGAAWGAEAGVGTLARTPLMPSTYVNVTDPTRQFETDEKGNVLQDEAGRPVLKSGWKVFREGFVDSFIENLSEVSGGHIAGTLGVGGKIVGKVVPQGVREAFAKTGDWLAKSKPGEMYKSFSKSPVWKFLKEGGYNGLLEEWGEEWYGAALRSVLTDPSALKDYATLENQLVTVASFLPMSALGGGVATGQMLKAKGQYKQTLNALQGLMKDLGYKEDQVAYLTDQIEASDAEKMASTIAPLINTLAGENEEKAGELFTAVADFSRAKGNYHLMNGAYEERMAARKAAEDKRMEEETGGYVNSSTGRVEIVADEEGNTAYVAGESLDGDHKVYILNKGGEKISVSREDFEEGYKVQGNFDKDEFLGTIIMNRDLEEEISEEVSRVEDVQETQSEDYASKVDENTAETFDSALDDGKYALLKDGRKGLIETTPGGLVADFLDGSRENITEDMIERPISDEEWLTAQEEEVQPEAEKNQYARQPEAEEVVSAISQETLPENVQQSKQIPVTDDGKPDYNAMSPEMFAEEFEKEFGPEETKAELEKMVTDVEAKIEKLHKKAPTDRNARAENKREILRLTKEKESVLQALERYIVKEEGQKDEQPFFSDEEEVVRWVIENSDDVNEVLGTYEAVKGLQGDITLPRWKQELQGVKINPESFYKESDRNLVTSELKRGWLSRDGRNIDEIAHELSDYGIEVTPQDIVDFMLENPSGHVRRKSSELDALEQRFSELATKVAGIKIGKPDSPTGKLFIKNLRTDSNMDQLREQINDLQRAEEEVLRSMAEQREAERKNEEIREEDSDLFRKSITLQENEKNNSNEISEQISQGEYGAEVKENGRVEEALIELRRRSEEDGGNAQEAGRTLSGRQQKEIEARAAEDYAKEKGIWIPMQNIFSLGEPAPSGNENDVYFNSQDNSVYKVNNLMNSGSIFSLLERIKLHNQYFPDTRYELVGFSGFGGRDTYPVLRQRYVENSTFATPKEIENYMEALGFERIGDAKYSNGDVVISDLRPRNVLKDSDNDFYVVDAEFEKIKQGNSLKDKEIQSDSEESQEDVSDEVLFREKENYTPEENIEEVNRRFNEELEAFEKGEQKGDLHLGRPGDVLLASGLNNTEMYITPKTLKGHLDKHGLKVDDIKDLPSALREPLFVYEWGDKAKSLVVITNIEHGNERITAAVKLERNGRKLEVNELASVHPKKGGRFVEEMINAKRGGLEEALRNVPDKRKALDWLGLVPPEGTASLTDQELSIANIIQNFENPTFQSGEISSSNDDIRFRNIEEVNQRFNERLRQLEADKEQKDRVLRLGRAGEFLRNGGIADAEIELEFDKFVKKSAENYKNEHSFSASDIVDLPKAINAPIAVFDSTNGKDKVILTELKKDSDNFIVAIKAVKRKKKGGIVLEINEISTLYPKAARGIVNWINTGKAKNVDKKKTLHWLEALQNHLGTELTDEELSVATNIIENFENPTFQSGEISSSNDDARYRFIGEKGAANLDKAEEATIRLDHLNVARDMEKVGKDAKAIKLATGWERGADGKWRYEMLDGALKKGWEEKAKRVGGEKLSDVINSKDLFNAYPQLSDVEVSLESLSDGIYGRFDSRTNTIFISDRIVIGVEGVLNHEIQHVIQDIEGFARGGNPSRMDGATELEQEYATFDELVNKQFGNNSLSTLVGIVQNKEKAYQNFRNSFGKSWDDFFEKLDGLYNTVGDTYFKENYDYYVKKGKKGTAFERYERLSGEVESRNVESRMNMTSEERRNSLASETEDVAREDQIFLNDALGVSASMESNKIEDINGRFNEELQQQINGTLPKGHVYRLGRPGEALRSAGIPNLPIELVASKLSLKASEAYESKHPFDLSAITNLPDAIQNPIAVFDSKTRAGSKVIMTELADSKGNHFVVAMNTNVPSNQYGKKTIQINSIRSVYPKDNVRDIVNWIDRGDLLKWVDKTKLGNWLTQQRSNSADVATPVFELDVAANIIQSFKNPTILEGEISAGIDQLSEDLRVPVKKVQSRKDLPEGIQRQMKNGRYPGLFDPKVGEVYMVMDEITDVADAQATMLHEIVGHKGIRGLFGDKIGAFTQRVLDSMPENEREMWVKKYNGNEQLAAEEYVARFAEGYKNPGVWEKIKAVVREFFRELGIDLKLSDNDLKYILWKAKNKLKEGDGMLEIAEKIAKDRNIVRELWRKVDKEKGLDWISSVNPNESQEISNQDLSSATNIIQNFENPKLGDEIRFREVAGEEEDGMQEITERIAEGRRAKSMLFKREDDKKVRLEKLRSSEPVKITGSEIPVSDDLKEYRKNAMEYGKSLRGEYETEDGQKVILNRDSLKEVLQHDYKDKEHLQSIAAIPQMIEHGIYIDSVENEAPGKNNKILKYDYYVVGLNIGNEPYTVKFVLSESLDGTRYYDHKLTQIEKGELLDLMSALSSAVSEDSNSPLSGIKDKRLVSILKTNEEKSDINNRGENVLFREVSEEEGERNKEAAERINLLSELQSQLLNERVSAKLIARKLAGYARNAFGKDLVEVMGKKDFDTVVKEIERGVLESKLPEESVVLTDERKRLILEYRENLGDKEASGKAAKRIREIDQEVNRMAKEALWEPMMRIGDVVAGLELKRQKERLERLVNLKVDGMNAQGVSVAKKVDEDTKVMLHFIRDHVGEDMAGIIEELKKKRDEAENGDRKFDNKDEATLRAAEALQQFFASDSSHEVIKEYEGRIKELKGDIKELESRIEEEKQKENLDKRLLARLRRKVKNKKQEIRYSAFTVIDDRYKLSQKMIKLNDLVEEMIYEGRSSFLDRVNEESIRRAEILREAMRDMDTRTEEKVIEGKEISGNKFLANTRARLNNTLFTPAWSFNYTLKYLSKNAVTGEGELYNRIVRGKEGIQKASENYYTGLRHYNAILDMKAREIFKKPLYKVMKESERKLDLKLLINNGHAEEVWQPSIGEALSVVMWNKMADGAMKLRRQGVSEEDIAALKRELPEGCLEWAEWIQEEFLPGMREKYNKKHVELFGSSMAQIDHYFPLKVQAADVYKPVDVSQSNDYNLPAGITGSIINRKPNYVLLDYNQNAFDLILRHGVEMEHWNAYSRVTKDLNGLVSNTAFRKMLNAKQKGMYDRFRATAAIALESYRVSGNDWILEIAKGATAAKISFRLNTALKQVLSYSAFACYSSNPRFYVLLVKNVLPLYWNNNFYWALENCPNLAERWRSRQMGDEKLKVVDDKKFWDKILSNTSKVGMLPNAFMDMITCANGAKAIYDYKLSEYKKRGYPEKVAHEKAKMDAVLAVNETQQSSSGLMMSELQMKRSLGSVAISLFNNSNFGYLRKALEGADELMRDIEKETESRKRVLIKDGMTEEQAERFARKDVLRAKGRAVLQLAVMGWGANMLWALGSNSWKYLWALFSDDDDAVDVKEEAKEQALKYLWLAPLRNLWGGNMIEAGANGYNVSVELPLLGDINMLLDTYRRYADEDGILSGPVIYHTFRILAEIGTGVDLNTVTTLASGIANAVENGEVRTENVMEFLNAPLSQIDLITEREKEGETLEEYIERCAKASYLMRALSGRGTMSATRRRNLTDRYRLTPFQRAKKDVKQDVKRKINQVNRNESLSPAEKKVKRESLRKERDKQMEKLEEKYDVVR